MYDCHHINDEDTWLAAFLCDVLYEWFLLGERQTHPARRKIAAKIKSEFCTAKEMVSPNGDTIG